MAVLKYIIPLSAAFLLTSCYEETPIDVPTKPVLCVNSLITAGEPVDVKVTHTWFFTDKTSAENHEVTDAKISVFSNGVLQDSSYIPEEGDNIRILVESKKYGKAEAEVSVPEKAPIDSIKYYLKTTDYWGMSEHDVMIDMQFNLHAEIVISDPAFNDNYFHFNYTSWSSEYPPGEITNDDNPWFETKLSKGYLIYDREPVFSEHVGVFESVTGSDVTGFNFFTDRQFSGRNYRLNINFENCFFNTHSGKDLNEKQFDCGFEFYVSSVSESYYKWSNYLWQCENGVIGQFGEIGMSEPIWGYSNVSTGAGVVAARTVTKGRINLKRNY